VCGCSLVERGDARGWTKDERNAKLVEYGTSSFFLSSRDRRTINVARATCNSFFEKIENTILKFQKNLKLNLQVDNVVIYNRANF
jgi:hypothetical protein